MKNILIVLLSIISVCASAQTATIAIKKENTKSYPVQETTLTFSTVSQTISGLTAPDTLIISGDTILTNWADTLIINFPYDLYDSYAGHTTLTIDAITGETALGIAKVITYTSPCSNCEFTKVSEDTAEPYDFVVPDMRLRLVVVATSGTGNLSTKTTLKSN